jgi:secondary thiamine-phosphate synthase enzyme
MELIDVTSQLQDIIAKNNIAQGLCTIFNPHTTAGVTINEGADPDVQDDIIGAMRRIVPSDYPYKHREGNSPSHVMATLTGSSVSLFVAQGQLQLGTWQRIFFCEFDGPRQRKLTWQILSG